MKRFIQLIAAIKSIASLAFTAGIMIVIVAAMIFGKDAISIAIIWQVIFLALIFGAVQFLAFSENAFPRMGTHGRMAFLCVSMLGVLAVFAIVFRWFPAGSVVNWLIFVCIYGALFAIATIVLRIVFRIGGLKYTEMLTAYKTRHNGN